MIEADDYPLSGADREWVREAIEGAADDVLIPGWVERPLDTEEMRYAGYSPILAEYCRRQRALERECNTVTEHEPAPWNRMLIVGAIACLIVFAAEVWGWWLR